MNSTTLSRVRSTFIRHDSLFRNSGAIVVSAGGTSVLGFAYWWLAARSFSPDTIGVASALISLMSIVGIIGEAGLGTLLMGEIVRWPMRKDGLVTAAMLTCLCICLIVGAASLPFSHFVLAANTKASIIDDIILLIGYGFTGLSIISDQAFVGMLQSTFRMLRQLLYSMLRVGSIVVVSTWFSDELGILLTWVGSLGLAFLFGEIVMRRFYHQSLFHRPDFDLLNKLKRRAVDHYMLDLGMMIPPVIMPYLVTVLVSASSNAPFTVIWLVISTASNVPSALTTVLFPVLRREPDQYREKMLLSLRLSLIFSVLFGVALLFSSSLILEIFNPQYVGLGGNYIGFLGFGLIGSVVRYHIAAAARLGNRMRQASVWVCVAALFELAGVAVGCFFGGLAGLAIGWPIATVLEGIIMLIFANPCKQVAPQKG